MSVTAAPTDDGEGRRTIALVSGLIVLSLAIAGLTLAATGVNPVRAYAEIVRSAFGSVNALSEDLVYATPIIFTSLSVILAFRCGLWNIGADGQLYLGAIVAVGLGLSVPLFFAAWLLVTSAILGGRVQHRPLMDGVRD